MVYSICFSVLLVLGAWVILRPRKVVRLRKLGREFAKINHEIEIFNRMRLRLPMKGRHAEGYIRWLARLHVNPATRCGTADAVEKLFYIYACTRLLLNTRDEVKQRQYYKNIIYTFCVPHAPFCIVPLKLAKRGTLFACRQPLFKYTHNGFYMRSNEMRFSSSYIVRGAERIGVDEGARLLTPWQISQNRRLEEIFTRAFLSRFVVGTKLKATVAGVARYVPTVQNGAIVFDITDGAVVFDIIDQFERFGRVARAGNGLTIIALYDSNNILIRDLVATYLNRKILNRLMKGGLFVFVVNRSAVPSGVVCFIEQMAKTDGVIPSARLSGAKDLAIVSRKNVSFAMTDVKSGVTRYHRLAPNQQLVDMFGRVVPVGGDAIILAPAYISSCTNSRKCTAAATTMSMYMARSKNPPNLRKPQATVTKA